jgi:hypothetical protein
MKELIWFIVGIIVGSGGVFYLTHKKLAQDVAAKVVDGIDTVKTDIK